MERIYKPIYNKLQLVNGHKCANNNNSREIPGLRACGLMDEELCPNMATLQWMCKQQKRGCISYGPKYQW